MSTKIYNGYKFKKATSLNEIHSFCHKLRDKVKPIAEKLYYQQFINEAVGLYDKNQYGFYEESMYFVNKEGNKELFWGIDRYMHIRMNHIKATNQRDPEVDFGFSISILPLKKRKDVLVLLYTEKRELANVFKKLPEVEDYHYQNQSDKPNNISEKKWDQRRSDWDDALGGDGHSTPMECGFTYQPYSENRLSLFWMEDKEKKKLNKLFPSLDERAKVIARNLMSKVYEEKNPLPSLPEDATKEQKEERYSELNKQYWMYIDYMKSDEGKRETAIQHEIVKPTLRPFNEIGDLRIQIEFHEKIKSVLEKPEGGKPYWLRER